MAKFNLTKRAMTDLVDIDRYSEEHWGLEQHKKYLTMRIVVFMIWLKNLTKEEMAALSGTVTGR